MDIIDRAQEQERYLRDEALYQVQARGGVEDPLYIDGIRCCVDCEKPIPEGRLRIHPNAVRCVACQEKMEQ